MKNSADFTNGYRSVAGGLICLFLFSCSGGGKATFQDQTAVFKFSEESLHAPADFFEKVAAITLIPLDITQSGLMAGSSSSDMIVEGSDFIIYDGGENSRINRFSKDGRFLNEIGGRGRGPKEYINLRGVQVLGDTLLAHFSTNETFIHYFGKDGRYFKTEKFNLSSSDMRKIGNDFLLARGYGVTDPLNRVVLKSPQGDKMFFESHIIVPSMGEASPMFSIYDDAGGFLPEYYLLRETFNDTIYMYSVEKEEFKPRVVFDFGEAGVKKSFFEQDNYEKAFSILFETFEREGFVTNVRFLENDKRLFGEFIQNRANSRFICFYEDKSEKGPNCGGWFKLSEDGMSGFSGGIKQLYNGQFYSLLQPDFCLNLPEYIKSKISNPQVLEGLGENSNCVVAVLDMK